MFEELEKIISKPEPFSIYSTDVLWTDEHTSKHMLENHLNPDLDTSSRRHSFIEQSANWLIQRFNLNDGKHIIDFGCGPGLYTQLFARSGALVTGIDFSCNSLAYAQEQADKEGLPIQYICQSYFDYEGKQKADLITLIYCDFCAMNADQRARMLKKFAGLLKPGGQIVLDVFSLAAYAHRKESNVFIYYPNGGFWSPNRYYAFLHTYKYDDEKVILNKEIVIEENQTRDVYIWHQYFDQKRLQNEFEAAGLCIHTWMGNVGGALFNENADEFAVIAEKM